MGFGTVVIAVFVGFIVLGIVGVVIEKKAIPRCFHPAGEKGTGK